MPVTAVELVGSRSISRGAAGEQSDAELLYMAYGTEDENEVIAAAELTMPALYQGMIFQSYSLKHQGGGIWEVQVKYSTKIPKGVNTSQFTFDTTGGKKQVKTSLSTVVYTPAGGSATGDTHAASAVVDSMSGTTGLSAGWGVSGGSIPDGTKILSVDSGVQITLDTPASADGAAVDLTFYKPASDFQGGINVPPAGGQPEGVEVPSPQFSFTVLRIIADPLPQYYANALELLTGKVNSDVVVLNVTSIVYVFQVGELRFMGATGGKKINESWEITLKFEVSRNADNTGASLPELSFGSGANLIEHVQKNGWDYLWISYFSKIDPVSHRDVPVPAQVNVEKVSDYAPLTVLLA